MIRTRQLAYRYRQGPALSFPDVEVPQGGVLLLAGPSGAGKSTWLALAAGLVRATEGQIEVAGQALGSDVSSFKSGAALDAWRARAVGFLPQKLHLSTALTVQQNLAMAQWAAGQAPDDQRISAALTALGVQDLAGRKPAQLSGGQAQRVALARAVLLQPKVILADEPTASLDDDAAAVSLALLQSTAAREGATLAIATHDARVGRHFAENSSQISLQRIQIMRHQL
ncbi:MAG: transporter related protein [Polaromonas sp.]|nr:transporter related protein [Polaromonas sp.]